MTEPKQIELCGREFQKATCGGYLVYRRTGRVTTDGREVFAFSHERRPERDPS